MCKVAGWKEEEVVGRQAMQLEGGPLGVQAEQLLLGMGSLPDLGFLREGLVQVKSFSPTLLKSGTGVQLVDGLFLTIYRCVTDFCSELPSAPPWQGNCCAFILCIHMVSLFIHSRFWTCFTFPSLLRLQFSMLKAKISCPLASS